MKKVLVLDPDPEILEMISIVLSNYGFQCIPKNDINEVYTSIEEEDPKIIIIDVDQHSKRGLYICKEIKNRSQYRKLPIILWSTDYSQIKDYKVFGANAILKKPFNVVDMVSLLDQNCNH